MIGVFSIFSGELEFLAFEKLWARGKVLTVYAYCKLPRRRRLAELDIEKVDMWRHTFDNGDHV